MKATISSKGDNTTSYCTKTVASRRVAQSKAVTATEIGFEIIGNTVSGLYTATATLQSSIGARLFLSLLGTETIVSLQFLNVQYADFNYPLFEALSDTLFPNLFDSLKDEDFDEEQFEIKRGGFGRVGFTGIFLDDTGGLFVELAFWLLMLLVARIIRPAAENSKSARIKKAFRQVWQFLHYNIFLALFFGNYLSFLICFLLQFQMLKATFEYSYTIMSFGFGLTTILFLGWFIRYLFMRLHVIYKEMKTEKGYTTSDTQAMMDQMEAVYGGMRHDDKYRYFFFFAMVIENTVVGVILVLMQRAPVLQCLSLLVVWVVYMYTYFQLKPFSGFELNILFLIFEGSFGVILLLGASLMFIKDESVARKNIGIIIGAVLALTLLVNLILALKAFFSFLMDFINSFRRQKGKENLQEIQDRQSDGAANSKADPSSLSSIDKVHSSQTGSVWDLGRPHSNSVSTSASTARTERKRNNKKRPKSVRKGTVDRSESPAFNLEMEILNL